MYSPLVPAATDSLPIAALILPAAVAQNPGASAIMVQRQSTQPIQAIVKKKGRDPRPLHVFCRLILHRHGI